MKEVEEWRQHPVYLDYEISSLGAARRVDIQKELGQTPDRNNYWSVVIRTDGVYRRRPTHILVCEAFHGPRPTPKHEVRHLNGNTYDPRLSNLAWGTKSENTLDSVRHGTHNNARKTHCKWGHEFTPENTYTKPRGGGRECRQCMRDKRERGRQQRIRQAS